MEPDEKMIPTGQKDFHLKLDGDLSEKAKFLKNKNRFFNNAIREKFARIDSIIKDAEELE